VNRNASVADPGARLPDADFDPDERRVIDLACDAEIAFSNPARVT
jgi:hypothetical protein